MCTAIGLKTRDYYFGRNLDLEYSFNEKVVITPRNYKFDFLEEKQSNNHFAMIGMATVIDDYPLYAEACNEKGLCIAGLYFPGNAQYHSSKKGKINLAPWELPSYFLGKYASVSEIKEIINDLNIVNISFNENLQVAPLHWMISDKNESITIESMADGLHVYDNNIGVLTNNPPFNFHQENIRQYMKISAKTPENSFSKELNLNSFGQGFGMLGIPGDTSPASRFIKAAFLKHNSVSKSDECSSVSQFFHILDNVSFVRGSTITKSGLCDITTYSSCINTDKGIYYYMTYDNHQISAINMHNEDLESTRLISYELQNKQVINYQN